MAEPESPAAPPLAGVEDHAAPPPPGAEPPSADSRARLAGLLAPLALALAVIVTFGVAIDGELVWDDATIIGAAARLRSPAQAFSRDLFDLGGAPGASYFRPLVTLSFALDLRLFQAAPQFGLHLGNLLWHALAAVLALGALRRWTGASPLACFAAALIWAVAPAKAESAAWISGRADPMGLALLLAALALRPRIASPIGRAALAGAATLTALLCKESFVIAPAVFALELHAARDDDQRPGWRDLVLEREVLASFGVALGYLALRHALLPIRGGGEAMFAGLGLGDRLRLPFETVGHALRALFLCHETHALRGPIAFSAPFVLRPEPAMALVGVVGAALVLGLAVRVPRARPAAALLGLTLVPIANLVPAGLESRISDRFLYTPSLSLALGLATALAALPTPRARAGALAAAALGAALAVLGARRADLFRTSDGLWAWERAHGDRAASVLHNAAMASLRARRFEEGRDRLLETVARFGELGFHEGYGELVQAVEAQVAATGERHRPSLRGYRALLEALVGDEPRPGKVEVPLPDGRVLVVPISDPSARAYAAQHARVLRVSLLLLDARAGREETAEKARAEVAGCPSCRGVLRGAARIELALAHPDRADALLRQLGPDEEAEADLLAETAARQAEVLRDGSAHGRVRALFLGEAYVPACEAGAFAGEADALLMRACQLAGRDHVAGALQRRLGDAPLEGEPDALRVSPSKRLTLVGGAGGR